MKSLLLTIGVVALTAMTINATAGDALLSPRAAQTQIKSGDVNGNDVNLVQAATSTVSPRATSNQIKTVTGTDSSANPALACAKAMNGAPRQIQACVEHATMPNCRSVTVATMK